MEGYVEKRKVAEVIEKLSSMKSNVSKWNNDLECAADIALTVAIKELIGIL